MASMKKSIEAKCRDCIYDPMAGGSWRAQVESCTTQSCGLWTVRPLTMATISVNRKPRKVKSS